MDDSANNGAMTPLEDIYLEDVERAKVHAKNMLQEYQKRKADKERIFAIPKGKRGSSIGNRNKAEKLLAEANTNHKDSLAQLKAAEKILIAERRALADGLTAGLEAAAAKEKEECAIAVAAASKAYLLVEQISDEATLAFNNATSSATGIQDVNLAAAVETMKAAAEQINLSFTEAKLANGVAQAATELADARAARIDTETALQSAEATLPTLKKAAEQVDAAVRSFKMTGEQATLVAAIARLAVQADTNSAATHSLLEKAVSRTTGGDDLGLAKAVQNMREAAEEVFATAARITEVKNAVAGAVDIVAAREAESGAMALKAKLDTQFLDVKAAGAKFEAVLDARKKGFAGDFCEQQVMTAQTIVEDARAAVKDFMTGRGAEGPEIPAQVQAALEEVDAAMMEAEQARLAAVSAASAHDAVAAADRAKAAVKRVTLGFQEVQTCIRRVEEEEAKEKVHPVEDEGKDEGKEEGKRKTEERKGKTAGKEKGKKPRKQKEKSAAELEAERALEADIAQLKGAIEVYQALENVSTQKLTEEGLSPEIIAGLTHGIINARTQVETFETSLSALQQAGAAKASKRKHGEVGDSETEQAAINKRIKTALEEDPQPESSSWLPRYRAMDAEEKAKFDGMAAEAIAQYLEDKTPIPDQLRRMIREIPEFAIEAATSTRGLAQHVLWTNAGNIKCLFHRLKRGVKDLRDGCVDTQMHHMIHGVPAGEGQESLLRGTVMCGCSLESALWDLFIWKTMTVSSDNPAVIPKTEYLNTNMLTPRHRAFFIQAYSAGTTLTLDDVYTGQSGQVFGTEQYLYRLQMLKVHRELEAANKNGAVLGLAPMTVTPVGLPAAGAKAQEDEMMKYVNA